MFRFAKVIGFILLTGCVTLAPLAGCGGGGITGRNRNPVIQSLKVNNQDPVDSNDAAIPAKKLADVPPNSAVILTCQAHDADRDVLTITWDGDGVKPSEEKPASRAVLTTKDNGSILVTCTVRDDRDGIDTENVFVRWTVLNRPPVIDKFEASSLTVPRSGTVTLSVQARDPEEKALSYEFIADVGTITHSSSSFPAATYSPPAAGTAAKVRVVVTDDKGNRAVSQTLTLTITG